MAIVNSSYIEENNFTISRITIRGTKRFVVADSGLVGLAIFESLDSLVTGVLTILDQGGIVDELEMTGNELVDIEFYSKTGETSDEKYNKTFRVTRFKRRMDEIGVNEVLEFTLSNQAEVENNLIKKSKTFAKKTVSEVVSEILSEFSSLSTYDIQVEPTLFTRDYHAPMVRPFDIIRDIMKGCSSKETKSCTLFFYEDREGIKFKSLGALKAQEHDFVIAKEGATLNKYGEKLSNKIGAIEVFTKAGANLLETTKRGIYGNRTITHSLINKQYKVYDMNRDQFIANNPLMNDEYQLQDDSIAAADKPITTLNLMPADGYYESDGKASQGHVECVRTMENGHMISKDIIAKIPGLTAIKVGDVVYLDHLTLTNRIKSEVASGRWLVTKLKHDLTQNDFFTYLELMTDSDIRRNR